MQYNEAIQLKDEARVEWLITQLSEYDGERLLEMARYFNGINGGYEWSDAWDLEELIDELGITGYELARAIIYGNVTNVVAPVRFNAYGNLETVDEWTLQNQAFDYREELARDILNGYGSDRDLLYGDEARVCDAWEHLDDGDELADWLE